MFSFLHFTVGALFIVAVNVLLIIIGHVTKRLRLFGARPGDGYSNWLLGFCTVGAGIGLGMTLVAFCYLSVLLGAAFLGGAP